MTVGGIGGQKLHVGAVCSRAAAVTGGTGVAGGPKGSVQGSSSHFYDCLKLCVNVGTTRQLWRKESRCLRLFLHMEERGNISDTCTCDGARAHTHIESLNTQTHFLAHTWRSPCRIALRTHCQRTYYAHRSALCTHTRAHMHASTPLSLSTPLQRSYLHTCPRCRT